MNGSISSSKLVVNVCISLESLELVSLTCNMNFSMAWAEQSESQIDTRHL